MNREINALPVVLVALCLSSCGKSSHEQHVQHSAGDSAAHSPAEPAALPRTASAADARVFFVIPADGDTVSNPVRVEFGIEGMTVAKAGDSQPDSGHHHLLIDTGLPDLGAPIPADANHIHFGDGRTTAEITLEPGRHTLRMLLGDHLHIPHDPPLMSKTITITVE